MSELPKKAFRGKEEDLKKAFKEKREDLNENERKTSSVRANQLFTQIGEFLRSRGEKPSPKTPELDLPPYPPIRKKGF